MRTFGAQGNVAYGWIGMVLALCRRQWAVDPHLERASTGIPMEQIWSAARWREETDHVTQRA